MPRPGFSAIIGNPPWVLYAGKGKQPIAEDEGAALKAAYGRAGRTLSTHGLFAVRAAQLVEPRGRVGLVMPSSVADASRYGDVRAAHDALCEVDPNLPDFGDDAFPGVFQPCVALFATRRERDLDEAKCDGAAWRIERSGVDPAVLALLSKLEARPTLPAELFGERGFRSSSADAGRFAKIDAPQGALAAPLYEGTSVREFELLPPTAYADPAALPEVERADKWRSVAAYIRQTARFPIACRSAGRAFRNSVLAGFARDPWSADALVAYLNSTPVRWFHFHKQRDARQGMPQVKIAHLRALPAPDSAALPRLAALGARPGARNAGISDAERAELDTLVAAALGLTAEESERVGAWGHENPAPGRR
jgi:Eco57I restriction-modification methylase